MTPSSPSNAHGKAFISMADSPRADALEPLSNATLANSVHSTPMETTVTQPPSAVPSSTLSLTSTVTTSNSSKAPSNKPPRQPKICVACHKKIEGGQFVRAVGCHYHLECFRCQECNNIVADKFFPVTTDGTTKIYCETDYFRRLDLICAKCGLALRGPYINALNRKYHMEHFTCSVCPTAFRQHDSYYERDDQVFCGYHYSIFHAAKCGGCNTAVLKNFVEINKDQVSKQWHPPCYMIYKLWSAQLSLPDQNSDEQVLLDPEVEVQKQQVMVNWAERILQVLSAFEESTAACISEMLLHFSNENNLQCVLQAARFIQHIDILFSTIESINQRLSTFNDSSTLQQTKEPKQLVKKIFYFFTNLSGRDTSVRQRATLGLIQQVTSLAHTLKKVIRTAFAGSLRLEQLHKEKGSVNQFLTDLSSIHLKQGEPPTRFYPSSTDAPCIICRQPFDDESIRLEHTQWHTHCFSCTVCGINLGDNVTLAYCEQSCTKVFCQEHAPSDSITGAERLSRFQRFINLLWCTWSRLCLWLKIEEKHLFTASSPEVDGYRDQNSSDEDNRVADGEEEFFDEDGEYTPSLKGASTTYSKVQFNWRSSSESDVFLSELSGLQHLAVRQLASLALHPLLEQYFNLNQLLEVVDAPKTSVWSRMVGAMKAPKRRHRGTFNVPLEDLVEQTGVESDLGIGPGSVRIPMIMDHCVRTLLQKEWKYSTLEGALMKKFLRDMPDPLLTFKLKDLFTASQKLEREADRLLTVQLICCLLPKPNLELLAVLSRFFHEVARYSGNPTGEGAGASTGEESVLAIQAVWMILENVPDVFKVPAIILGGFNEDGPDFNPASKYELQKKYDDLSTKVRNLQVSQNTGHEGGEAMVVDIEKDILS
ncbi:hypothetical protein BDV3_004567 [Batrachochytrium dendrobatidis]